MGDLCTYLQWSPSRGSTVLPSRLPPSFPRRLEMGELGIHPDCTAKSQSQSPHLLSFRSGVGIIDPEFSAVADPPSEIGVSI